jgi:hypothetical protein
MTRFYVYTAGGFLGYVDAVDRVQATTALQREFPHWDLPNAVFRLSLTPPPPPTLEPRVGTDGRLYRH